MRGVSRRAPLLSVLLVFTAAGAWAHEPTLPTDPPQARISPPSGVTAQARISPPSGAPATGGGATTQARMQPPVGGPMLGELSCFDVFLSWLQSRLSIPNR